MANYYANHSMLSSGQLVFADPSIAWDPSQFPNLPPPSLAFTANGRAATGNLTRLAFSNARSYEAFEPINQRSNLLKAFLTDVDGQVRYAEPTVGFVSSIMPAFSTNITEFIPSANGGPGINDVTTPSPDTITNALGKLDAWIANAFLYQPPAVKTVEFESNVFFGGVRWENFNTYACFDKSVPYVTTLMFIIGDPTTSDYLTFTITNPIYFPFRKYADGISPINYPIVRLRIFTDFFPPQPYNLISTKAELPTNCISILNEEGDINFPEQGNVLTIENTDGVNTYTTLSIYLPDLVNVYPKGTAIPVKIVYLNAADQAAHVCETSVTQTPTGEPGPVVSATPSGATQNSVYLTIKAPIYSDLPHQLSSPYISSYNIGYSFDRLATAHTSNVGFRYGVLTPADVPDPYVPYTTTEYDKGYQCIASTQSTLVTGLNARPLGPGVIWSTTIYANNQAQFSGEKTSTPYLSTLFPTTNIPINISSANIINLYSTATRYATASSIHEIYYGADGKISTLGAVDSDVLYTDYRSTTQLTWRLDAPVQFNDPSYPGDRSTITISQTYQDAKQPGITKLINRPITSDQYDFNMSTILSTVSNSTILRAVVADTQTDPLYQQFIYKTAIEGAQVVSSLSTALYEIQVRVTNTAIPSAITPTQSQTYSTPLYVFRSEPDNYASTYAISTTQIMSTTQISGLYTPLPSTLIKFDLQAQNFANVYSFSNFATGTLTFLGSNAGPTIPYSTNFWIYSNATPITTGPIPQNTILRLSSLSVFSSEPIYTDPADPDAVVGVSAVLTPANPRPNSNLTAYCQISSLFMDTVSFPDYISSFNSTINTYGRRVLSLIPRLEDPGVAGDIEDGVDGLGNYETGLDVSLSSFVLFSASNTLWLSSIMDYNHNSSLSNALYTNFYARELIFTNAKYTHVAGINFSAFNGAPLGIANANYPDFTYDLAADVNYGNRYATFAYEWPTYVTPTPYRYLKITIYNPNLVSSIQTTRSENNWWPNYPISPFFCEDAKVRMHVKIFASYYNGVYNEYESAWFNGLKILDEGFDDSIFDSGACAESQIYSDRVEYKVAINRRFYTKLMAIVRVGISQDGSVYSDSPISFSRISVEPSDA
jgi:hypothetical protein